jgi:hypothetical protein
MRKHFPGRLIDELVLDTESASYASTIAEQSGSRVVRAHVEGGQVQPIGKLMAKYEAEAAIQGEEARAKKVQDHDKLLNKYGFDRDTPMQVGFTIELELESLSPPETK